MRLLISLLLTAASLAAQTPVKPDWGPWASLIGVWVAETSAGQPGKASAGEFAFEYQLDGRVMVRKSFAEYAATKDRPASRHDDLTVLYPGPNGSPSAIYWDNEGHVIEYSAEALDHGTVLRWVSATRPGLPRFRFTYRMLSAERLAIQFEIAPPNQPESVSTYVEATLRKKS